VLAILHQLKYESFPKNCGLEPPSTVVKEVYSIVGDSKDR
jgi:hypothetical protein